MNDFSANQNIPESELSPSLGSNNPQPFHNKNKFVRLLQKLTFLQKTIILIFSWVVLTFIVVVLFLTLTRRDNNNLDENRISENQLLIETSTPPFVDQISTPQPVVANGPYEVKLMNIIFKPESTILIFEPNSLISSLIASLKKVSSDKVNYTVVDNQTVTRTTTKRLSDGKMDYNALLDEFDICQKLTSGEIDEVWVWVNGADGNGWEYTLSGNLSDGYSGMKSCGETLFVMGFDYTRDWELALHSMGHRLEFVAQRVYKAEYLNWDTRSHRYIEAYDSQVLLEAGVVGCGNVHFPPNATGHYDYSNKTHVQSSCSGTEETIDCSAWNCTQRGFLEWWFSHIPELWWGGFLGEV